MSSDHDQPGAARRELPNNPDPTTDLPPTADSPFSEAEALGAITEAEIAEESAARASESAAAAADLDLADAPVDGDASGAEKAVDTETEAAADVSAAEAATAETAADQPAIDTPADTVVDAETVAADEIAAAEAEAAADVSAAAAATVADANTAGAEPAADRSATDLAASDATPADEPPAVAAKATETPARTSRVTATSRSGAPDLTEASSGVETIVHVLRHGEVHNPKGILYGRLPGFSLSVTGRAQAGAVARALSDHDIAVVIASPLQRAQETAAPIAEQHGVLVRTDENLIEAGNTFEGLRVSVGDGALRKPRHWWKLRDPFTPSWGEPYLQIAHRMLAAVNKARVEAAGREAVLVSHQLPVWTLRRFLQGQRLWHDPRARQCSLASLTSLVYQGDTLVDIVYSEPAGGSDPTVHGA